MHRYAVLAQLVLTLIMVGVCIASPALFDDLTQEDHFIEWLTAVLFIGAGVAAGIAARKASRRRAPWTTTWALGLLCVALLVVGGEEISWGQRIFSLRTPEGLKRINSQEEVNLHNVATGAAQKAAFLGSLLFGVCLPAACLLFAPIRRLYETRLHLRVPGPLIAIPCLLGYALADPDWLLPTLTLGFTYACCGAFAATTLTTKGDRHSWPEPLILAAGIMVALMVRVGLSVVGEWTNGWMELGEQSLSLAAFLLAFSTLAGPPRDATTHGNHG